MLRVASENNPHTAKLPDAVTTVEKKAEIREVASNLKRATDDWTAFVLAASGAFGAWIAFNCLSQLIEGAHGVATPVGGPAVVTTLLCGLILWRSIGLQAAKEQERVLREMQQLAAEDPLALEPSLPDLRRVARRHAPHYGPSARIARKMITQIEQARAASSELPIACVPSSVGADLLPIAARRVSP